MELTQLVRHGGEDLGHRLANRVLTVRHDSLNRHRTGLTNLLEQRRQILLTRREQALGQQDLTRETITQDPQHLMADIGLQTIQGQHDAALSFQDLPQSSVVREHDGAEFVVAIEEIGDRAFGDRDVSIDEMGADLGDGAMLAVAKLADEGDDIQSEFVTRQREGTLGFGPVGYLEGRAPGIATRELNPRTTVDSR